VRATIIKNQVKKFVEENDKNRKFIELKKR